MQAGSGHGLATPPFFVSSVSAASATSVKYCSARDNVLWMRASSMAVPGNEGASSALPLVVFIDAASVVVTPMLRRVHNTSTVLQKDNIDPEGFEIL